MTQAAPQDGLDPIDREVGRYLLEHKVIDRLKIQEAIEYSRKEGCGFRRALLALELVDLEFLQRFLPKDAGTLPPGPAPKPAAGDPGRPAGGDMSRSVGGDMARSVGGDMGRSGAAPRPVKAITPPQPGGATLKKLGEYLVEDGVISAEQLDRALEFAAKDNHFLGSALINLRMIDEEVLSQYIIRQRQDLKKAGRGRRVRLGDILVARKTITAEQLQQALEVSVQQGKRVGEALVDKGFVKEADIALALAEQLQVPVVNLRKNPPDPTVTKLVSKKLVVKHQAIPYRREGTVMTVAMVDPLNIEALDDVKALTNATVIPVICTPSDFQEAVKTFLGGDEEELLEWLGEDEGGEQGPAAVDEADPDQAPIISLVNKVVASAVKRSASDIHFDPGEDKIIVRLRQDGKLREFLKVPLEMAAPMSSRIKVMSNLNVAETRLPQDGKFRLKIGSGVVDFRVSILPLVTGEKIVLRILDQSKAKVKLKDLGMPPRSFRWFTDDGLYRPNGIVLVTGPTGSGKTSTLYAGLMAIQDPKVNIHTVEDPVEFSLPGVTQVQVHTEWGLDFAGVLRAFLRQDPDVILVGEIRDTETARIALKAAMTGHLVLSTLHTNDAVASIDRLISMGVDRFLVATAVKSILAQRLVARLCTQCAVPDPDGVEKLKRLGFDEGLLPEAGLASWADVKIMRPSGCSECEDAGYRGRAGIFEVIRVDDELAELIINGASNMEIYQAARRQGMITLRESALIRAAQGVTDLEEVVRLTVPSPSTQSRGAYNALGEAPAAAAAEAGAGAAAASELAVALRGLEGLAKGAGADAGKAATRILELFQQAFGDGKLDSKEARLGLERMRHYLETFELYAGELPRSRGPVDLAALVRETALDGLPTLARKASILLEKKIDPAGITVEPNLAALPPLDTDGPLLGQALGHLVLNALEAMPGGGKLRLALRRTEAGVEILVGDNGGGLPEVALAAARQPFHTTRPYGLGLGLPVVERILARLGGSFELVSSPGKGTVGIMKLPAAAP